MRGPIVTLLGTLMVAASFSTPIVIAMGAHMEKQVDVLGGVIAHGIMPHKISPIVMASAVPTPEQEIAARWP